MTPWLLEQCFVHILPLPEGTQMQDTFSKSPHSCALEVGLTIAVALLLLCVVAVVIIVVFICILRY